jgi:hypothetical protein
MGNGVEVKAGVAGAVAVVTDGEGATVAAAADEVAGASMAA